MIAKIIAVGLITALINNLIKQYRPELSMLINICGGVLIVLLSVESLNSIIDSMINLSSQIQVSQEVITPLLKVIGIGYITEFSADIAEESGNKSISSKIIFGGNFNVHFYGKS